MTELKLARLPDRTPVKITITVLPELNQALRQYAEIYRATYGEAESVADVIPFMLCAFLDGDKGFVKAKSQIPYNVAPQAKRPMRPINQLHDQTLSAAARIDETR